MTEISSFLKTNNSFQISNVSSKIPTKITVLAIINLNLPVYEIMPSGILLPPESASASARPKSVDNDIFKNGELT